MAKSEKQTLRLQAIEDSGSAPTRSSRSEGTGGIDQAAFDRSPLVPLNDRQGEYIYAINNKPIVLCTGVLGSSKTYVPTIIACDLLRDAKIEKIIVARPCEGKAKSAGFFKGSKNEKLEGWCKPVTDTMKKRLGRGNFEAYLAMGKIELMALEQVKGLSLDDTFLILDEAEDLEPAVAKSVVTRMGQNSTIVIAGDIAQQDLKHNSGLEILLKVIPFAVGLRFTHIDFDSWDYCVRSAEAKAWGMAFEKYEQSLEK
ncbi:MAG: PhoH family protein [Ilumatobacteraceae bacterium]|nr:PhoH family protein [Ilumatobacteraceae bacterium]